MRKPHFVRNGSPRGEPIRPLRPMGYTPRSGAGLLAYERVLARAGFAPIAGIDEAGRGACAGPLVVAAVVLPVESAGTRFRTGQLADSKSLTPAARERVYGDILRRALAWHVVVIPARDIDQFGLHVCNVSGMRRAVAGLGCRPGYVLTDGFPVSGMPAPGLAIWKGDQVAACVAAASVLAKVTRDRIMTDLHERYPDYEFAEHKGYVTERHAQALSENGPCPEHRFRYANVNEALRALERSANADLALMDDAVAEDAMKDVCVPDDAGPADAIPRDGVADDGVPDAGMPDDAVADDAVADARAPDGAKRNSVASGVTGARAAARPARRGAQATAGAAGEP